MKEGNLGHLGQPTSSFPSFQPPHRMHIDCAYSARPYTPITPTQPSTLHVSLIYCGAPHNAVIPSTWVLPHIMFDEREKGRSGKGCQPTSSPRLQPFRCMHIFFALFCAQLSAHNAHTNLPSLLVPNPAQPAQCTCLIMTYRTPFITHAIALHCMKKYQRCLH